MASPSWLDAAASYATCQTLTAAGGALVGTGVATMAAGGSGVVPLSLGMLSLLGAGAVCQNTPVDGTGQPSGIDGCYRASAGGYGVIQLKSKTFTEWQDYSNIAPWIDISEITEVELLPRDSNTKWVSQATLKRVGGGFTTAESLKYDTLNDAARTSWRIRITNGACDIETGDPLPYPPDFYNPIDYTNPETNCTYNIYPQGFVQESDGGGAGFVMKIEAAPAELRQGGGIVGGCNFEPTLVYQPPGGQPPTTIPWDPEWPDWDGGGTPPWLSALIGGVGGAAVTAINNALAELFETSYPEGTREIYAACNYKENGDPETFSVTFPEESYQDRVLTSLNAIVDFQQQILLWRTPTCATSSPKVGDYRTISFISDEESPNGKSRLAKRFRYRSSSGVGLDGVVDHWKDFTWSAGPVCVQHRDTQLGAPQVWAASIDEGKRVIRHAATEAGIDPDTTGRWEVSGSDNPRYGMPGTMRVNTAGGYYWITSRLGPDQRPPVALT